MAELRLVLELPQMEELVSKVDDLKAVLATVRSKKVVEARVRTPGTIATLTDAGVAPP